jgi:hypothetical protein
MNEAEVRQLLAEAVALIDDLCEAYRIHLFRDDLRIRDAIEKASHED